MSEKETNMKMQGSALDGRDFSNMNLENSDFSFSSLTDINFDGANLRNAKMRFAALDRTTFRNADLTNADLSFSSLSEVDLTGAKVDGANFSYTSNERSFTLQDLSLMGLIQSRGWVGTVVAVVLGALVLYGMNAVIYFTAEIFYTYEPIRTHLYQFLVINGILSGMLTILLSQAMTGWMDKFLKKLAVKHLILTVVIVIANNVFSICFFTIFGTNVLANYAAAYPEEAAQNAPWYWYMWGPIVVANTYYYLRREGQHISRKISDQEYQLLNLEKLKTRAELDALQARINPHFLYNALNSIASLVHDNPDKAEEMTLLLSKLFRYTTGRTNNNYFDSIEHELEMVETYLQVEKVRFGERLRFSVEVSEDSLRQLQVPRFILQPIVENAIKHGVSHMAEEGIIVVKIYSQDEWLRLCVHDNGPQFSETMGAGYGIRSIQEKLKLLYGDQAKIELLNEPHKAVTIAIHQSVISQDKDTNHAFAA